MAPNVGGVGGSRNASLKENCLCKGLKRGRLAPKQGARPPTTEKTAYYIRNYTLNCLGAGTQSNRQWPSQVGAATIWLLLNATQKYLVVTRRSAFPSEVKQFGLLLVLFLSRENLPMVQRWQRIQKMFSVLCDPNETL